MTRSQTRGRGRRGPAHKPMTYQEQLQQLQPPKELYRTSLGGTAEYQGITTNSHLKLCRPAMYKSKRNSFLVG